MLPLRSYWLALLLLSQEVCYPRRLVDPASLADWNCSCLYFELIPSVTEKSVIFIKELSFPHTAPTDDAFFNQNLAGACWGHWAGPGSLAGWSVGSWIVGAEVGLLQCWSAGSGRGTPMQKQERRKNGRQGLRP